jgi:hypothetical protein
MNLRDLFPDQIDHDALSSRYQGRSQLAPAYPTQGSQPIAIQPQRQSQQYSPPSQQRMLNSQINSGLGINANQPAPATIPQYQQQQQQQLQQQPIQPQQGFYNANLYGSDISAMPDLDFLQSTDYNPNVDTNGIDLGFGPGMDFQHDWSDGTGVDLFDGFFFGNNGG